MPNPAAPDSLPPHYFDDVYRANPDPWSFATSPYEAGKYAASLAALTRPKYESALEAGCSIGVFTAQLAARCSKVLAIDVADQALAVARQRCADLVHVRFENCRLPSDFPAGQFDLIILSEVGYYLALPDLHELRRRTADALAPGGHLLLVHWTPPVPDYPLTGDEVHDLFLELALSARGAWQLLTSRREEKYRLDLLEKS